jgi:hypothetical protein
MIPQSEIDRFMQLNPVCDVVMKHGDFQGLGKENENGEEIL